MIKKYSRVTPQEIILFHQIFAECHNYSEVARQTGRSRETIKRYVGLKNKPNVLQYTTHQLIVQ